MFSQEITLTYGVIGLLVAIAIIPYIFIALLYRRFNNFIDKHKALKLAINGKNIDEAIEDCLREVIKTRQEFQNQENRLQKAELKLRSAVDRLEVIRFNAFEHMSNDLSFTVAMLNQDGDGVVLTSINNREDSRIYAKPIYKGDCSYHLMDEEKNVIAKAKNTVSV